jgi:galactokinase
MSGVWVAPGRVNLIGEHTDYTGGYALPLAVPRQVRVTATVRTDGALVASSAQLAQEPVSLTALSPGAVHGWAAYPAGVLWAMRSSGYDVGGLELAVDGDLPLGAGLSSSAALACAVAFAASDLYGLDLARTELARLARLAENEFVGVPTGVMDQLAVLFGEVGHALLLDTRAMSVEPVPLDLAAYGLALLVIDTGAPHTLVTSGYADRLRECQQATAILGVPALRDVRDLDAALATLPGALRPRVRHVVTENARVLSVVDQLRSGADPRRIGPALTASHASLRDDYEVSAPQLDTAVEAALAAGAYGARMTGGGFGGSAIALVDAGRVDAVSNAVTSAFAGAGHAEPAIFPVTAAAGAHRANR